MITQRLTIDFEIKGFYDVNVKDENDRYKTLHILPDDTIIFDVIYSDNSTDVMFFDGKIVVSTAFFESQNIISMTPQIPVNGTIIY